MAGDLSGRPKNLWGVAAKMRAKGRAVEQVYDVRALRVVVHSKADCYEVLRQVRLLVLALGLLLLTLGDLVPLQSYIMCGECMRVYQHEQVVSVLIA